MATLYKASSLSCDSGLMNTSPLQTLNSGSSPSSGLFGRRCSFIFFFRPAFFFYQSCCRVCAAAPGLAALLPRHRRHWGSAAALASTSFLLWFVFLPIPLLIMLYMVFFPGVFLVVESVCGDVGEDWGRAGERGVFLIRFCSGIPFLSMCGRFWWPHV